ncbi:hypothetical protein AMTRI_Chr13g122060 [Amborella trichopoda]|uniref:Ubiquitin-like domain-containing protein n=1 Tax=Amborella trichopoda TaxID=13333 RepID=U5D6V9_AMBTC|nr:uncharacterized protein LOC18446330 [Amborella trichopoda]ERN17980.1 hypothetical protein AMTR_s00046p00101090 [Amborella trichopoda]|eukprot:XP_006856513.1 uncharacterized protein LOC18446330 [Amborella trichopoda]
MPDISQEEKWLPIPQQRRHKVVFSEIDGGFCRVNHRRSFSYAKLPQPRLRLSVLKLDGSSFEVQVEKTALVFELKQAIEEVFSQSPKESHGKISWSHVWGHFCLSYDGYKLVDDKASLRSYGIKDGDQLPFIRHLSLQYDSRNARQRSTLTINDQNGPLTGSDPEVEEKERRKNGDGGNADHMNHDADYYEDDMMGHAEFKLAHFLKGWLSYSKLWSVGRTRLNDRYRPSRF